LEHFFIFGNNHPYIGNNHAVIIQFIIPFSPQSRVVTGRQGSLRRLTFGHHLSRELRRAQATATGPVVHGFSRKIGAILKMDRNDGNIAIKHKTW
jgi:hypothetical protein